MFSLNSKKKEELSLVLDIQSDLVRAAVVQFCPLEKPHVIYSLSQHISFDSKLNASRMTDLMLKAVSDIGMKLVKDGIKGIKSVHYVFSSPWVIPQSKTVKIEYENEIEIKDSVVLNIINKERKELIAKFKENNLNNEYEFDISFIEENVFDVRLNGYSVTDYKGKKAKSLEISFATTLSSYRILDRIDKTIKNTLKIKKVHYHSALLLRYTALRSLIDNKDEYISVHIHGELTDIVVVKRNFSSHLASFPFGRTTISRKLSNSTRSTMQAIDSSISMYEDERLERSEQQKIMKLIQPIIEEWKNQFMNSIKSMGENEAIPHSVYLSTHRHFKLFKNIIESEKFEVFTMDDNFVDKSVIFDRAIDRNSIIGIYAFALNDML